MNADAPSLSALAGSLRVAPGAPRDQALRSMRQDWAARLGRGKTTEALPGLMASVFNLCSHAHRQCSQLALAAAIPGLCDPPQQVPARLRQETAQEHVRRIGLEWPGLLDPSMRSRSCTALATAAMQRCPLLTASSHRSADPWPAMRAWLQGELLQFGLRSWLRAWETSGADWLLDWCLRQPGWLPALVHVARRADRSAPIDMVRALRVHADPSALLELSSELAQTPGFALRPQWRGDCAHSGSWARLNSTDTVHRLTPWEMLGGRIAELIRLCLPDEPHQTGAGWLSYGSLPTGPRQGLAWMETARGLLIYQVEVEAAAGSAPSRVAACHVIAPTEWNFHPQGEVAQRIAAIDTDAPAADIVHQVQLLMAAFDPCVPFSIDMRRMREPQHA